VNRHAVMSLLVATVALLAASCIPHDQAADTSDDAVDAAMNGIRPEAMRAHVRFLADDLLEGRGTGTRGYRLGANYVAAQFEVFGLEPAGTDGSYFQPVPLRTARSGCCSF
jgi:hypothetical protein